MRSFPLGLVLGTLGPILFDRPRYRLNGEPADNRSGTAATSEAERRMSSKALAKARRVWILQS
jgi:hypothetical protein